MLTLLFTALSVLSVSPAHAQLLPPPAPGEFQLRGEFSLYNTSANYGGDGNKNALPNGTNLKTMSALGEFIFDWTEEIRFHAGFTGGETTAYRQRDITAPVEAHSNSGISEAWAGGQYWYHYASFDLIPDAEVRYPFARVNLSTEDPLLSDGALSLIAGAWLTATWGDWRPFGYLGYQYRDEGRASLMPYHLGIQWLPENGWWIQGEFRGYQTIANDSNSDNGIERDSFLTKVDASSYKFYALNPASHEFALMVGTHFGQMGVYASAAFTYMGRNSADGFTGTVGLTFDGSFYMPTPRPSEPQVYEDKFNVKPDKYDERLFNSDPVPRPAPPPPKAAPVNTRIRPVAKPAAPVQSPKAAPGKTPAPGARIKPAKGPMPTVELMIKDTEKALEKEDKKK